MKKPVVQDALREQQKAFVKKFGRWPQPEDPLFFDPDFDNPTPYAAEKFNALMVDSMKQAGIRGSLIYAYEKTGMMLSSENKNLYTKEDLAEWDHAMEEYFAANPDAE